MSFITKEELYTSADIKIEAKKQLEGYWKAAMLLAVIPVLFSIFFVSEADPNAMQISTARSAFNMVMRLIHGFILTSVSFTLLDFLRNREQIAPLEGALHAFKREYFMNLLLLKVVKYFYTVLWTLLFIIPGLIKSFGYSQAELIFKDTVDRTGEIPKAADCLKQSEVLMKGHKMDLFTLQLSFIGWYILSFFTFGLLFNWLTPYMEMSQVVFYENLLENKDFSNQDARPVHTGDPLEEVGKDPNDFRDFDDF